MPHRTTTGRLLTLACAAVLLSACANNAQQSTPVRGSEVSVRYAEIEEISRKPMPSAVPAGAMIGGFTGLMINRKRSGASQLGGAAAGALLGGLATRALEGERLGYVYRLRFLSGEESNFYTEKNYLQEGDCVAVERGTHTNLRRVSDSVCGNRSLRAEPFHVRNAQVCEEAKQQLLDAKNEEAVQLAAQKVKVICDF